MITLIKIIFRDIYTQILFNIIDSFQYIQYCSIYIVTVDPEYLPHLYYQKLSQNTWRY